MLIDALLTFSLRISCNSSPCNAEGVLVSFFVKVRVNPLREKRDSRAGGLMVSGEGALTDSGLYGGDV